MNSLKQLRILTGRIMRQNLTDADTMITVVAMPVFMLLFFVYILGGNVVTTGSTAPDMKAYLAYSLPGFLLIAMGSGSAYTALRINNDQTSGFLNRLHSLPIKRWVILGSHVVASVLFMIIAEIVVLLVGFGIGYRVQTDLWSFLGFIGISILFAFSITLLAIPFSLKAKNYASAGGFSYIILMLLFVSSAFMPTKGMAKYVRIFANNQPMTPIVNTARGLLQSSYNVSNQTVITALIWLIVLAVIFAILSYVTYKRVYIRR